MKWTAGEGGLQPSPLSNPKVRLGRAKTRSKVSPIFDGIRRAQTRMRDGKGKKQMQWDADGLLQSKKGDGGALLQKGTGPVVVGGGSGEKRGKEGRKGGWSEGVWGGGSRDRGGVRRGERGEEEGGEGVP